MIPVLALLTTLIVPADVPSAMTSRSPRKTTATGLTSERETVTASSAPHRRLYLRLIMQTNLADEQLDTILDQVDRIWRPAGFAVQWRLGASNEFALDAEDVSLQVVIRDRRLKGGRGKARALGWIKFLAPSEPRPLVTLSMDATRGLLRPSLFRGEPFTALPFGLQRRLLAQALGRSLAHEIGHYVLASTHHTNRGLMRASFSAAELTALNLNDFLIDDGLVKLTKIQLAELQDVVCESSREPGMLASC